MLAGGVGLIAVLVTIIVTSDGSGPAAGKDRPGATVGQQDRAADRPVRATLTLERTQLEPDEEELIVSLPNERLNTLQTTRGATSVLLTCVDEDGRVSVRQRHPWPLVVEAGYPPHIHQPATPELLDSLRRCRLTGRGIAFVGSVR
ncbi:MAG TPA: hypothetical protein VG474_11240, partial [Solirubrobacteraceae bacterium]|nr:hypothetical protein [Solirubrobacteraceae bacterium]